MSLRTGLRENWMETLSKTTTGPESCAVVLWTVAEMFPELRAWGRSPSFRRWRS